MWNGTTQVAIKTLKAGEDIYPASGVAIVARSVGKRMDLFILLLQTKLYKDAHYVCFLMHALM